MYDMLGYKREAEFLSFGDVNALVHPDDSDLYALAEKLSHAANVLLVLGDRKFNETERESL